MQRTTATSCPVTKQWSWATLAFVIHNLGFSYAYASIFSAFLSESQKVLRARNSVYKFEQFKHTLELTAEADKQIQRWEASSSPGTAGTTQQLDCGSVQDKKPWAGNANLGDVWGWSKYNGEIKLTSFYVRTGVHTCFITHMPHMCIHKHTYANAYSLQAIKIILKFLFPVFG